MDGRMDPRRIVREGYERVAPAYLRWNEEEPSGAQERYTRMACDELPAGGRVLELGCGAGWPTLAALGRRFRTVGVDLSRAQLSLAAERAPGAALVEADLTEVAFAPGSFDGVVAFFVLLHVPRDRWASALTSIRRWLRPGGRLYLCAGTGDDPGSIEEDFLGAPMFFSGWAVPATLRLIEASGFRMVRYEVDPVLEHGTEARFLWLVARAHVAG
jgi:cyclopropane fatty-acyl-phospholipid synthase-like methyltransferase